MGDDFLYYLVYGSLEWIKIVILRIFQQNGLYLIFLSVSFIHKCFESLISLNSINLVSLTLLSHKRKLYFSLWAYLALTLFLIILKFKDFHILNFLNALIWLPKILIIFIPPLIFIFLPQATVLKFQALVPLFSILPLIF